MKIQLFFAGCLLFLGTGPCFSQANIGANVTAKMRTIAGSPTEELDLLITKVETKLPSGKLVSGSLVTVFAPKTHLFWWMHETAEGPPDIQAVLSEFLKTYTMSSFSDEIICFTALGRTLWVRESSAKYGSLQEGVEAVIKILPEQLDDFEAGRTSWFKRVPIARATGQEFFHAKNIGDPPVKLSIQKVERSSSGWAVQIKNENGGNKTVVLNRDLNAVKS